MTRRLPPAAPLLFGVVVLVLIAVLSATADSAVEVGQGWVPGLAQPNLEPDAEAAPRNDGEFETPTVLRAAAVVGMLVLLLVMALLLLIGLVLIGLGIRFGRWRRRPTLEPINPVDVTEDGATIDVELMRRAAGGALDRLRERAGGDPGDAVVLAWLMLEQAGADSGLARRPHQTPTEFATAVLAELDVDRDALDRLRRLYQRARFSGHPVTEGDVRAARRALGRVVADLGEPAARAPAAAGASAAAGAPAARSTP